MGAACAAPQRRRDQPSTAGGAGARNTCVADTSSGVVLVRQSGEGNCVLGKTWGFDAKGVWVADGCRGTFAFTDDRAAAGVLGGGRRPRGLPGEHRRRRCARHWLARLACSVGRWGYDQDGVWVSDGCQGTFVLTTRGALECGSDGTRQHCAADTSAGVVLARTTAPAAVRAGADLGL